MVKMPLLHFLDTGLAAYLLKWGNPEALERGAMSGAFFESYVFSEIYKSYLNAGKEPTQEKSHLFSITGIKTRKKSTCCYIKMVCFLQ